MKLQKQRSYEYEGKEHYKYAITIPKKAVEKLKWKAGEELEAHVGEDYLVIKKIRGVKTKGEKKMSYEEFRMIVERILRVEPEGLTWTEIKKKAGFYQKVPNNMWVRLMETDIGLVRDKRERRTIWRLKE